MVATTYQEAVELAITASNQLHDVINGDAVTTVPVEDGSTIPTVRKTMLDNYLFKTPVTWAQGSRETVFNQLRSYKDSDGVTGWYYAPTATVSNPVDMGSSPVGDSKWVLALLGGVPTQIGRTLRSDSDLIDSFDLNVMKGKMIGFDSDGKPIPVAIPTVDTLPGMGTMGKTIAKSATATAVLTALGISQFDSRITANGAAISTLNTKTATLEDAVDGLADQLVTQGTNFNRTIRTKNGETLTELPDVNARRNQALGFDNSGNPVIIPQVTADTLPGAGVTGIGLVKAATPDAALNILGITDQVGRLTALETSVSNLDTQVDSIDSEVDGLNTSLTTLAAQVSANLGRTIRAPSGDTFSDLPNIAIRGSKILGFDNAGNISMYNIPTVSNLAGFGTFGRTLAAANAQANALTSLGISDHTSRIVAAETAITGLNTKSDRALKVPAGETVTDIPNAATRAGKVLGFDANGAPIAVAQSSGSGGTGTTISVASVTALRALEPTTDGQIAYLEQYDAQRPVAGGTFIYDAADTTTADDGGWCFVTAGGKRWKRNTDKLLLAHYGYTSLDFANSVDLVPKWKAYIEALRVLDQPVCDVRIGTYARLKSEIVFSDATTPHISVLQTEKTNTFKVNPAEFVAPTGVTGTAAEKWAICFGDRSKPDLDGRLTGFHIEGYLAVENDGSRKTPTTDYMNGIYAKMTWGQVGVLRAYNFRGTGIWICATWDSTFESLSAERCGHEDDASPGSYCMRLSGNQTISRPNSSSGPDTFNASHIKRLQTEQAFGHGLYISQSVRLEVDNLHMERMTITKTQNATNGYGHVIVCGNSSFGQAVIDRAPITNPVTDTDGVAQIDTNMVVQIGSNNSVFTSWLVEGSVFISECYGTVFSGLQSTYFNCPAPARHITLVGCRIYYYATIEREITLLNCHLGYTLQGRTNYVYADPDAGIAEVMAGLRMGTNAQDCNIIGGRIARLDHQRDNLGGNVFTDVTISEQVQHVARPKAQPYANPYTNVLVTTNNSTLNNNQIQAVGVKAATVFQNCSFYGGNDALAAGADATYGGAVAAKPAIVGHVSSHMVIKGGWVRSLSIVDNCVVELLDGVQVGKLVMPATAAVNAVRTQNCMCRDVTNWNLPLAATWPVGTMVTRCGANPTSGQGVAYICVDSTTKTTTSWAALYTAP